MLQWLTNDKEFWYNVQKKQYLYFDIQKIGRRGMYTNVTMCSYGLVANNKCNISTRIIQKLQMHGLDWSKMSFQSIVFWSKLSFQFIVFLCKSCENTDISSLIPIPHPYSSCLIPQIVGSEHILAITSITFRSAMSWVAKAELLHWYWYSHCRVFTLYVEVRLHGAGVFGIVISICFNIPGLIRINPSRSLDEGNGKVVVINRIPFFCHCAQFLPAIH